MNKEYCEAMNQEYYAVLNKLKCLPCVMSLHRIAQGKASTADKQLIAQVVTNDIYGHYDVDFKPQDKIVRFARDYDPSSQRYYKVSAFYLPDVFQGLKLN